MGFIMRTRLSSEEGFSPQQWDEFVRHAPSGHLLQTWAWGDLKARFGWQPERIAVVDDSRILAGAQVLFRRLPPGALTTAYIPKGPLLDPAAPSEVGANALLSALHNTCRRRRAIFLKVEPDWEDEAEARGWLKSKGFVPSQQTIQPRRTVVIDLRPPEEAILAQMKPKTRYNIRLAERKGVSVQRGRAEDLAIFYELLRITSRRDGFAIHTQAYYRTAWELFSTVDRELGTQEAAALFLAQYEGRTLAALMAFAWGKRAWYMYGASSDDERQRMPNHLLQWQAMLWAKVQGCQTYDLWGIPDLDESDVGPHTALAEEQGVLSTGLGGLYRFKRGFGGRDVRFAGAYDYIYHSPLYRLLTIAWNWRKRMA